MRNYTILGGGGGVRKSYESQASKKFNNKYSENSRSQIVFRRDIFQKLSLGDPDNGADCPIMSLGRNQMGKGEVFS